MKKLTVAVCVDDDNGMTFLGKRQSRDRVLVENFVSDAENSGKGIYISPFSKLLFADVEGVTVCNSPFSECESEGYVFVENISSSEYIDITDELVIYRWNRKYLSDFRFDTDPIKQGFAFVSSENFVGSSHDKITKEIYRRKKL